MLALRFAFAALALSFFASSIPARAASSSPPPPVAQPMAAPTDTTDWLMVSDVDSFANGQLDFCKTHEKGLLGAGRCATRGSMTPQQALAKLGPPGAQLTGFSPYMTSYGRVIGVVLYYKKSGDHGDHFSESSTTP